MCGNQYVGLTPLSDMKKRKENNEEQAAQASLWSVVPDAPLTLSGNVLLRQWGSEQDRQYMVFARYVKVGVSSCRIMVHIFLADILSSRFHLQVRSLSQHRPRYPKPQHGSLAQVASWRSSHGYERHRGSSGKGHRQQCTGSCNC